MTQIIRWIDKHGIANEMGRGTRIRILPQGFGSNHVIVRLIIDDEDHPNPIILYNGEELLITEAIE